MIGFASTPFSLGFTPCKQHASPGSRTSLHYTLHSGMQHSQGRAVRLHAWSKVHNESPPPALALEAGYALCNRLFCFIPHHPANSAGRVHHHVSPPPPPPHANHATCPSRCFTSLSQCSILPDSLLCALKTLFCFFLFCVYLPS